MKHITEYNYEYGHTFNGFRVSVLKKGIEFRKYVTSKKIGRDAALAKAIRLEAKLVKDLKKYNTMTELIEFKELWNNGNA